MARIRKFYLHSKLNFGKFAGRTVESVLHDDNGASYLLWCNEKMKKICFDENAMKDISRIAAEQSEDDLHNEAMDDAFGGWDGHKS